MSFKSTYRVIFFPLVCLCHLTTTVDTYGGYYLTFQQPQYLRNHLFPRRLLPEVASSSHNTITNREIPFVDNGDQNLEDQGVQSQPKYAPYEDRGTKELTHRAGDSIAFVDDSKFQQSSPDVSPALGEFRVSSGNRENEVPDESTTLPQDGSTPATAGDPSRCVWAIISCCSPGSDKVRHPCFELLGCPGPFWDTNPCNVRLTGAAVKVVGEFYSSAKQD